MTARRAAFRFGACAAALLAIVGLLAALAVFRPRLILPLITRALAPAGGSAAVSDLKVGLFPPALALAGLAVDGPAEEGMSLRLSTLRLVANVRGLLTGGPWLELVEAGGLVYERSRPEEAEGAFDLSPLRWLFRIDRLSLADARLRIAYPWGIVSADGLTVSLVPGEGGTRDFRGAGEFSAGRGGPALAGGTIEARGTAEPGPVLAAALTVREARVDLPWIGGEVSGGAGLRVTPKEIRARDVHLSMSGARLGTGARRLPGSVPVHLDAAGSVGLDGRRPSLTVLALEVGGLLRARGQVDGPAVESLAGTVEGEALGIERVMGVLVPEPGGPLKGMELAGDLPFRADLRGRGADRVLGVEVLPRDFLFSLRRAGISCRLDGTVKASGSPAEWSAGRAALRGDLRGTGSLERSPWNVRSFRLDAPLGGSLSAPALPGLRISMEDGEVSYEGRALSLGSLTVHGSVAAGGDSFRLEDIDIRAQALGRIHGGAVVRGGEVGGSLEARGLKARVFPALAGTLAGRDWKDWTSEGTVGFRVRAVPEGGGTRIAAEVTMEGIGFRSPAGDVVGQALGGRFALHSGSGVRPRVEAGLTIAHGEVLWDTVYVDLAREPLDLNARFARAGHGRYDDIALEANWAGFLSVRLDGGSLREDDGTRRRGHLLVQGKNLAPLFRSFLREPLAPSHPALAGLEMEGEGFLDLSFSGSGDRTDLSGRLDLRVDDLRRDGELPVLSGLRVDLPIAYALGTEDPGIPGPTGPTGWGRLRLEKVRLAGREIGPLDVPVALVPNRLHFGGTIDATLYGGTVRLRGIRVDEPLSRSFRANLSVRADGLDLSRLSGEGVPLEGILGGTLDPVSIGWKEMRASGTLRGDFFGGEVEIRRLSADLPFVKGREIGADVNFARIDLERLSRALGFGRVTGRLSGSAEGLRIAYGQPVAFRLRMRSVPVKGVPQVVSLKAVNSISLVSTGSALSGLGYSLMTTFFREFPYREIGIACELENDVFTVRGLIHQDGVEYLVKRPLFAGIDVINRNPDNRIGFSDMVERLKRVTAGDTLDQGRRPPPGRPAGVEDGSGPAGTAARAEEGTFLR